MAHPRYLIPAIILVLFGITSYHLSLRLVSQIHYQRAVHHNRNERFAAAADHLEKAVRRGPQDFLIWKELGKSYHDMARSKPIQEAFQLLIKSAQAYLTATRLNPLDAEAFYKLARETAVVEQLNDFVKPGPDQPEYDATPYYRQAIRLRPKGVLYHYGFARYLHQKGNDQELLEVVKNLTRTYPPAYGSLKKELFWSAEVKSAAIKGVQQAIAGGIFSGNANMLLSSALAEDKDWSGAILHYEKALSLQRQDNTPANFYHLGRLYLANGQTEKARTSFLQGLTRSTSRKKDIQHLYYVHRQLNAQEQFERFFQQVSDRFQLSNEVNITIALNLIDLKRYDQARRILAELNQEEPSAEAYYLLYRIARLQKDWDRMELAIQKATVHDPGNSGYHMMFSQVLVSLKKFKTAEDAAGRAIQHAAQPSAALYHHRAQIRWNLQNYGGAAGDWETAIGINPKSAHYHARAAEAYIRLGNIAPAETHYKQAADLNPKNRGYQKKYQELKQAYQKEPA
ncbi:tetratricopeptide repeat protein [Thermodesulfobacteriota bacterium]